MKIFSKILLLVLFLCGMNTYAQEEQPVSGTDDDYPLLIIDHREFGSDFCLLKASDSKANYFVIDLEKLPSDFDKTYFLSLVFELDEVVSIDSDFDKNYMWFKAFKIYEPDDILAKFKRLKSKTEHASKEFSDDKKALWLKVNNK